jgi:hypothetical protein
MVSHLTMQAWKTNFVKLFPWPFRAFPPRPSQSKQQPPPRYLSTPPNENMKIRLCAKAQSCQTFNQNLVLLFVFSFSSFVKAKFGAFVRIFI